NASGNQLLYSTYLGGNGFDQPRAIAVDADGNATVVGVASSTNFPVVDPIQGASAGGVDDFITTFEPNGAVSMSTYLGSSGGEDIEGVAVSGFDIYVAGSTDSAAFPVLNAAQPMFAGVLDGFLAKLSNPIEVTIDIKPGSDSNPLNLAANGVIPVAIFG